MFKEKGKKLMKKFVSFAALLIACIVTLVILSNKQSERKVVGSGASSEVPVPATEVAMKEVASATNIESTNVVPMKIKMRVSPKLGQPQVK